MREAPRGARPPTAHDDAYSAHIYRAPDHRPRGQHAKNIRKQRERRQRKLEAKQRRQRQLVERWARVLVGAGQRDAAPRGIPLAAYRASQLMRDGTAAVREKATRVFLAQLPRDYRAKVIKAATRPEPHAPGGRAPERTELEPQSKDSRRGRLTLQLGILLYMVSEGTKRRGYDRVARGLGRGVYANMLKDYQSGQNASLSTLFGGDPRRDVPAIAKALEQAGAIHYHQPPSYKAAASDRGPSGFAYNVYWIRRGTRGTTRTSSRSSGNDADWLGDAVADPLYQTALDPWLAEHDGLTTSHN